MKHGFLILFMLGAFWLFTPSANVLAEEYLVGRGDTLWEISKGNTSTLQEIIKQNPQISNPNLIFPGQKIKLTELPASHSVRAVNLLNRTNELRIKAGLMPLKIHEKLNEAAARKSEDMKNQSYFAHKSPTYGNPRVMLKKLEIPFLTVYENIGVGPESAEQILYAWMNSSLQRGVLLSEQATHMGAGYTDGGTHGHYWTIFIVKMKEEEIGGKNT